MLQGLRTVVHTVAALDRAKAWYTDMLGQGPYFDQPFYVGFNVGGYELGLMPAEAEGGVPARSRIGVCRMPMPPTRGCWNWVRPHRTRSMRSATASGWGP